MLHGTFTAIITPFRDGKVDEAAWTHLIERQIAEGVHGLAPCGTTGEAATLKLEERQRLVELCVQVARGRVPVIAGAGSNDTAEAIELTRHAKRVGADAAMVVAPYYNRPSQEGILAHFRAINEAVQLPLLVYNVPSRTGVDISVETMARLSALPNVIGCKDATGDLTRVARHQRACAEGFLLFSGDDPTALGFNAHGGVGCISVTANVVPGACAKMQEACLAGDFVTARRIDQGLTELHRALVVEPSPAPTKYALALLGLCREELRLPLLALSESGREPVRAAMRLAGCDV